MSSRAVPGRVGAHRLRAGVAPWLVLPALLLLAVFVYRPLARSVQLTFFGSDLLGNPTRFVGLRNWRRLFVDPGFLQSIATSILIALLAMVIAVGTALFCALLLREWLPARGLFQVVFSLPFAYSAATASAVFFGMFGPSIGAVDEILAGLGIDGPPWLQEPGWAIASIALATGWYESGFAFLVMIAAVRSLPEEVIEAAALDGAGGLRLVRRILLPMMWPSIFFLVVTQTITGLQTFTQVYVLTGGGPSNSTTTLVFKLYQLAFGSGTADYSQASVVAVLLVVLVAGITATQFALSHGRARP